MKRGAAEVCTVTLCTGLSTDYYSPSLKRQKLPNGGKDSRVTDYSDPFAFTNLLQCLDTGKYGSVTKEVHALIARQMQLSNALFLLYPELENDPGPEDAEAKSVAPATDHVFIIDSDEEDDAKTPPVYQFQGISFPRPTVELITDHLLVDRGKESNVVKAEAEEVHKAKDKGVYVGVEDELSDEDPESSAEDDGLSDIWKEMNFALETSKEAPVDRSSDDSEEDEGCDHSFVLKDDIGYVCRVCGVIQRAIETIFDFQYIKAARIRSSRPGSRYDRELENSEGNLDGLKLSGHDLAVTEISPHPRHKKQMKPHQLEGFNFLLSNLITENPGGCILAHAPGSGKTFMIISFMQSFLAHYPDARPLVVLPKGILPTWKREFQRWQVEDISLLDFYSMKAENRHQQSEVLKQWVDKKSILFLGYKQFSTIVSGDRTCKMTAYCREVLLKCPTILILDEGHNPRNDDTDMLNTLAAVQTPRKVVLSGTLYQNHVKEVFTILNLVRPKFLKIDTSRAIKKRILSRVAFNGFKKNMKGNAESNFYDLVEHTLQQDADFKRKEAVIKDLREMTSRVLHYYRGDFLDDLPGLLDFTVLLQLRPQQKRDVQELKRTEKAIFRKSSVGCAVYTHPTLKQFLDKKVGLEKNSLPSDSRVDELIETIDYRDGVKAKFFYNVLSLCESTGEKLLVFSQYLLPLKFLERLAVCRKGYRVGREIFMITGDTSAEQRETSMEKFNTSDDARVFFGSIKACGEGISLVGASRVIILDVHLNPSVSRQAIGRAFRPGQDKKVYVYRLVAADSPEEKDHLTCFKKEQIAKRWFEWNEYSGKQDFDLEDVDPKDSGDRFLESELLANDIHSLHTR
ncbi:protein CHROMATIN REMODELING 35-like isoform X1 [Silene latifolia]|uniref:protein CHROMATIN REMODELING 35-like isoform X1 n=1 Tax=Silene latifolia TaxID=37657 RepID=UPI003D782D65